MFACHSFGCSDGLFPKVCVILALQSLHSLHCRTHVISTWPCYMILYNNTPIALANQVISRLLRNLQDKIPAQVHLGYNILPFYFNIWASPLFGSGDQWSA